MNDKDLLLKIDDNILDKDFIYHLNNELESGTWRFDTIGGHKKKFPEDKDGSYKFWGKTLFKREPHNLNYVNPDHRGLTETLLEFLHWYNNSFIPELSLTLYDIHCNGQTIGQNGHTHEDIHPGYKGLNFQIHELKLLLIFFSSKTYCIKNFFFLLY